MSDAIRCDGCPKVILVDSDEISNVIRIMMRDNEAMDFCGIECAYHWFELSHDSATCTMHDSLPIGSGEDSVGKGDPESKILNFDVWKHHKDESGEA